MEIKMLGRMISINSVLLRINPEPIAYDIGSTKIEINIMSYNFLNNYSANQSQRDELYRN